MQLPPSCDSPDASPRFALGASSLCLVGEHPTCSWPALCRDARVYGHVYDYGHAGHYCTPPPAPPVTPTHRRRRSLSSPPPPPSVLPPPILVRGTPLTMLRTQQALLPTPFPIGPSFILPPPPGAGWGPRCKTRLSLRELDHQGTVVAVFFVWWLPRLAVE